MTHAPRSIDVGLQSRNIFAFADAVGLDFATVAEALDASGMRLQRDYYKTPSRVLEVLNRPTSTNGDGKRKRSK